VSSILASATAPNICNAQGSSLVRNLDVQILPEDGAPVVVSSARVEADMDPFGVPIDVRMYADYKNVSNKPVSGVKFRVRYVDAEGKDRGTFHAPHLSNLGPGMTASEKWRQEKIDPRTVGVMVRVLAVKFQDGTIWESAKAGNIVKPDQGGGATSPSPSSAPPAQAEPEQSTETPQPDSGEPAQPAAQPSSPPSEP
jgi:hypothetical protein